MLSDNTKADIQSAYRQFLKERQLKPRYGQKSMIAVIANILSSIETDARGKRIGDDPHVCVIEAGTGTGKTLAYLLAAIPVARALDKTLIVSTATIALQEQIVNKDLPEIKKHTDLSFTFSLAKGRGRYLCLSKLERILMNSEATDGVNSSLFTGTDAGIVIPEVGESAILVYQKMVDAMVAGQWDGDRDNWSKEIDQAIWTPVTTSHRECTGRRCSNVSNCSFFKAREAIYKYDCIVANHDLVLADLALGGGAILPDPGDCIYVFDEGHHLADKALKHFSFHARVAATSKWLEQCQLSLPGLLSAIGGAGQVDHYVNHLPELFASASQTLEYLYPLCQQLIEDHLPENKDSKSFASNTRRLRFEHGLPPAALIELAKELENNFDSLNHHLTLVVSEIQNAMEYGGCPVPKVDLETWFPVMGNWTSRAEINLALWRSFASASSSSPEDTPDPLPVARWITIVEFSGVVDFELCSSPILAASTLQQRLWDACFGAVITSATLSALGNFEQFKMRTGTGDNQHYAIMPGAFDFGRGVLQVPDFVVEANQIREHTESLVENLPKLLAREKSALVLFSSRKQMEEVFYQLPHGLRATIMMQGDASRQLMISGHKQKIDKGQSSALFGLASFAEGVDLPGDYCRHVIIAKLPFAVPDDPVEAALSEWIEARGGNAFMQIAVPDAAIKMVQACGRLLRTETDSGTISILDKRLLTKRYGRLLLDSLPAYTVKAGR